MSRPGPYPRRGRWHSFGADWAAGSALRGRHASRRNAADLSPLRKSLRVKPYYLCHGRLGPAAQLVAHEQCRYDAGERGRAENPIEQWHILRHRRPPDNPSKFKHPFNMDASRELEVTGNFPLLRFFGHR